MAYKIHTYKGFEVVPLQRPDGRGWHWYIHNNRSIVADSSDLPGEPTEELAIAKAQACIDQMNLAGQCCSSEADPDSVYYRIGINAKGEIFVACLQQFDEHDYSRSRWITERKFYEAEGGEEAAIKFLCQFQGNSELPNQVREAIDVYLGDQVITNCLDKIKG